MKLSIMSYCYGRALSAGTLDFPGVVRECARLGADIELMRRHVGERSAQEVKALVDDLGVRVPILLESCAVVHPDPGARAAAVEGLWPAIELCHELGAKLLMFLPGGNPAGAPDAEVRRWIGEGVHRACEMARGSGIRVVVENHGGAAKLRGRIAHMLEFCTMAPELGLVFDNGNFYLAGEDLTDAFNQLRSRVVHTHFKDWHFIPDASTPEGKRRVGAVIGEGVVDTRLTLSLLRSAGYQGYCSVEYEGPEDPVSSTARATENLKRLMAEG